MYHTRDLSPSSCPLECFFQLSTGGGYRVLEGQKQGRMGQAPKHRHVLTPQQQEQKKRAQRFPPQRLMLSHQKESREWRVGQRRQETANKWS